MTIEAPTTTRHSITRLVESLIDRNRRPEDGLLHCSQDLLGPMRHAQLRIAGAPFEPEPIASQIRLMTGTMWHQAITAEAREKHMKVMSEVDVSEGLPLGWSGTLDHLFWDLEYGAWRLKDVKTQRAEAFAFDGGKVKADHQAQLSAYWHAAVAIGFEMVREMVVAYIPMSVKISDKGAIGIDERFCEVLDKAPLWAMMNHKTDQLGRYIQAIGERTLGGERPLDPEHPEGWLLPELADVPPRVQKLVGRYEGKGRTKVLDHWDLKMVPDWRAAFCPYPAPLCFCHEQGETKLGEFQPVGSSWLWKPIEKHAHIEPTLVPEGGLITF